VAAVTSGRFQRAELIVPGRLETAQARERVHARVRDHARRAGKRAHARHAGFAVDRAQQPVTVFIVLAGTGRRVLTPVTQARIRAAYAEGGVTQRQLAARFGVAQSSVGKVVRDLAG